MAKIAIVARGNKSKRESTTTGDKWVEIDIRHGNRYIGRVIVDDQGDTLEVNYEPNDGTPSHLVEAVRI